MAHKIEMTDMSGLRFHHYKDIPLNKDVNGAALDDGHRLVLALGNGTLGGLGELDLESGEVTVHQKGRPFRQILCQGETVHVSTQDSIHTYDLSNLEQPTGVFRPGRNVWGLALAEDGSYVFGDTREKEVYKRSMDGSLHMITSKARDGDKNHLKSVWAVASSRSQCYISDRKKRQVVCHDLDSGKFLWKQKLSRPYKKYKTLIKDLASDYIGGICTDESGNLYVCDTIKNKLTRFSPDGASIHYKDLALRKPGLVAINRTFLVVITGQTLLNCTVRVFKIGHQP